MTTLNQDQIGRCSFIDVLEEAALRRKPVAVHLRDGTYFIDEVSDVVTNDGTDYAVFRTRGRLPIENIQAATRAEPEVGSYDAKL